MAFELLILTAQCWIQSLEENKKSFSREIISHRLSSSLPTIFRLLSAWQRYFFLDLSRFHCLSNIFFVWKLLLGHISRYLGKSDPSTFPVGVHILILAETSAIDLPPSKMTCHFQGHRYCHCCCLFSIFFAWVLILIFAETSAIDLPPSRVDPSPSLSPNLVSIGSTHSISCSLSGLEIFKKTTIDHHQHALSPECQEKTWPCKIWNWPHNS